MLFTFAISMVLSPRASAHVSLLLANIIYGANYTIARIPMNGYVGSSGFILLRVVGAAILFLLTGLLVGKNKITPSDHLRLFLCACFGVAFNQLLFFKGLSITGPINAAIMMLCSPLVVAGISFVNGTEKIKFHVLLGMALGMLGAGFLLTKGFSILPFSSGSAGGDALIFLNAAAWGIYLVLVKPMIQKYATATVMQWVFFYGTLAVLPFGFTQALQIDWTNMPVHVLWAILYVVIGTTYVAYFLNNHALTVLSPTIVTVYIYLQPVLASLFAIALGADQWQWIQWVSLGLVFGGLYLVNFRTRSSYENS